jgi:hypothetical protein
MRKNLGKELKKAIRSRKATKMKLSKMLGISRPTLDQRLEDGDFTYKQVLILIQNQLL